MRLVPRNSSQKAMPRIHSLVAAACLLTAQALHPLQILPVGRPLLPLDQISYIPRKGDARREAAATDAWLAKSLDDAIRQRGVEAPPALRELQDAERDSVLRFGPENPRAALEASVLRLPRAFADFAAARRELHAFALARASGALDAAEARRILEGASTGARLDDARERFSRVYVPN